MLLLSTLVDFYCGIQMARRESKRQRRPFLLLSLFSNLGILFFFKYFDFFTASLNQAFGTGFDLLAITLPMGISFYTFQTMAYSIDVYYGKVTAERHLGKFALYVSFFPQLVAGPIERAGRLLPQLQENRNKLTHSNLMVGLTRMLIGFFKKVVVADLIAVYVESVYGPYELHTGFTLLLATYLFAIQIYCDFSGYTDIAIGSARILGYDLMENFRTPYFAKSVTEFWRRWHISLSTWLRDYLYIPLGGNRLGKLFTYRNLMLTMLLGGLWHGAAWTFVIWGGLHGLYLGLERLTRYDQRIESKPRLLKLLAGLLTFHLVCLSWVFFRAGSLEQALAILEKIATADHFFNLRIARTNVFGSILITTLILFVLELTMARWPAMYNLSQRFNRVRLIGLQAVLLLLIVLFGVSKGSQFIYFQF
jgi:D-alanyl-lipoteichoic acid acyltransferase DltB (MBOAT superfamily)